ncbi:hypothetical protein N431DRAFT_326394 [Stipitochalara longipes BDJ]|nr:hypothetical protein N431DRAFT_326394 [Stipitochalara longipes BDJ]
MASPFDAPEKPPCECHDCSKSFRTLEEQKDPDFRYTRSLSDTEAVEYIKRRVKNMLDDFPALRKLVRRQEMVIQSRWRKKTRLKRYETLMSAMKDCKLRQYELTIWDDITDEQPRLSLEAVLFNYLTMERLTAEPGSFLGLLKGRLKYEPATWLLSDNQRLEWVWKMGLIKTNFSKVMMCIVADSSNCYSVYSWHADSCKRGQLIGFPRAVLLLKAQRTIIALLKNVIQTLLMEDELPGVKYTYPLHGCYELKYTSSDKELWCTYFNQPLTKPRVFADYTVLHMVITRLHLVADHLQCLQVHWRYLHQMILQNAAAMGPAAENVEHVIKETVAALSYDIWNYWSWRLIYVSCQNIHRYRAELEASNSSMKEFALLKYEA